LYLIIRDIDKKEEKIGWGKINLYNSNKEISYGF
jgi:hypothetical protein